MRSVLTLPSVMILFSLQVQIGAQANPRSAYSEQSPRSTWSQILTACLVSGVKISLSTSLIL